MASYRLIDEQPGIKKRRPPFSPYGLFFLNWLWVPLSIPFWIINWGRLGQPEKRLLTGILGLMAFAAQIYMALYLNPKGAGGYSFLPTFVFGYFQLNSQRTLYQAHLLRGGAKAPAWPVWLVALLGVGIQLTLLLLRST